MELTMTLPDRRALARKTWSFEVCSVCLAGPLDGDGTCSEHPHADVHHVTAKAKLAPPPKKEGPTPDMLSLFEQ